MNEPVPVVSTRRRRWLLPLILLIVLATGLLWLALRDWGVPRNRFGVAGGLKLGVPSDMRLYVGDKLVGVGTVELSWDHLFGVDGRPGLAMMLEAGAGPVTAEMLAGPGAAQLKTTPSGATSGGDKEARFAAVNENRLLRRADGSLDQVFTLDGSVETIHERKQRFLIVIRPRFGPPGQSGFVEGGGHGTSSRGGVLGITPRQSDQFWVLSG